MLKTTIYNFPLIMMLHYASPRETVQRVVMGVKRCPHYDNYFNRLLLLQYRGVTVTTAVFIDYNRAITSFNPYRMLSKDKSSKDHMYAVVYKDKKLLTKTLYNFLTDDDSQLKCGRQIIPMKESSIRTDQWHGVDRKHCPVHDLMVFRLSQNQTFLTNVENFDWKDDATHIIGPMKAELAGMGDELGATVKIGAIGIEMEIPPWNWMRICSVEYNTVDVSLDCDEWLPRNWGHFICIDNKDEWVAMKSGAFLVSADKVFGVGSFLMTRGKQGILAFTDVRPYQALINQTCTKNEQNPKTTTETTSTRKDLETTTLAPW